MVVSGSTVLWLAIFGIAGPLGFNPTDDGFILAQSYRMLHGEIPHLDFISPRLVGSPLLHLVDFFVPLPLLEASRLVAAAEFVGAGLAFGSLIFGRWPSRWRPWEVAAAGAATLVSLHTFPLLAWHTVDGLLLIGLGFALCVVGPSASAGLVLLGAAVVVKQSFIPAPLLGAAYLAFERRPLPLVSVLARSLLLAAIPAGVYVALAVVMGAGPALAHQLASASPVYGVPLVTGLATPEVIARSGLLAAMLAIVALAERQNSRTPGALTRAIPTLLVLAVALGEGLVRGGAWGVELIGLALVVLCWGVLRERRLDWPLLMVIATGWMVSLSWGYTNPDLAAGFVALAVISRLWIAAPSGGRSPVALLGACAALGVAFAVFLGARHSTIYRDRNAAALTVPLRRVAAGFGFVRTNTDTAAYLEAVRRCVSERPAQWTAIVPDNAGLYPLLHLRDPFPVDWQLPREYRGSQDRLIRTAASLDRRGDYLVLVQSKDAAALATSGAPVAGPQFSHDPPVMARILEQLHGTRVVCGPFLAIRG